MWSTGTGIWRRSQAVLLAFLFAGTLIAAQSAAWGQDAPEGGFARDQFNDEIPRGETVRSRTRPEVDPVGMHAGGFLFYPSLRQSIEYNDNIFADENNEKSDFIYTVRPNLSIQSDWNNHRLAFVLGSDIGFYFDESDENYQDFYARAASTIEITARNAVRLNLDARRSHESRDNPNDVGGTEPTLTNSFDGTLQYVHRLNRFSFAGGATVRRRDFEDVDAGGGITINNDDRDRTSYRPGLRLAYEVMPSYSVFVRGEGVFVQYDDVTDDNGFKRDSRGFDAVAGVSLDITGLLFGDIFGGYRKRYYDDSRFDEVQGSTFGAALTWIPTKLTTVVLKVDNEVAEAVSVQASSFTSSGAALDIDHELLRNLILSAGAGFRFEDYEGINREESIVRAGVSADYLMNRHVRLRARYSHRFRNSNVAGRDFSQNSTMLFLTLTP